MKTLKMMTFNLTPTTIAVCLILILSACAENKKDTYKETNPPVSQAKPLAPEIDIHTATITGDLKTIQQHINAGSDLNIKEPAGGSTPLITAVVFGKPDVAKALIEGGADLNLRNNDGSTALYCAAFFGRTELVEILLEKGADKDIRNNFGSTALEAVSAPFNDVKGIYDQISKDLGPLGFKLNYEQLKETRPVIADMLR